jgi:hypothetical protein
MRSKNACPAVNASVQIVFAVCVCVLSLAASEYSCGQEAVKDGDKVMEAGLLERKNVDGLDFTVELAKNHEVGSKVMISVSIVNKGTEIKGPFPVIDGVIKCKCV